MLDGRWETDAAPGLLLYWRQREGVGWEGWVIAADPAQGGATEATEATEATVRQSCVPASAIRPVDE